MTEKKISELMKLSSEILIEMKKHAEGLLESFTTEKDIKLIEDSIKQQQLQRQANLKDIIHNELLKELSGNIGYEQKRADEYLLKVKVLKEAKKDAEKQNYETIIKDDEDKDGWYIDIDFPDVVDESSITNRNYSSWLHIDK